MTVEADIRSLAGFTVVPLNVLLGSLGHPVRKSYSVLTLLCYEEAHAKFTKRLLGEREREIRQGREAEGRGEGENTLICKK